MVISELVVGIDLGTTNTCVACFINGEVKILENCEGKRTIPSNVFFPNKSEVVVGNFAKHYSTNKPERGVTAIKRIIGRKFSEIHNLCNLNSLPFQIRSVSDVSDEPLIVIKDKTLHIEETPHQISAHILESIKQDASAKLGEDIDKAVITVPAYFNVSQRKATLEAAKLAGFTVLKLLNEPTAAALSYYYKDDNTEVQSYSLIYDLGGGTFDVAILERHKKVINIISVDGDSFLGGHDFDNLVTDYLCDQLWSKYTYNPKLDKRAMRRLNIESVSAKESLSTLKMADVYLHAFSGATDSMEISLSREQFETMSAQLFKRTIEIVDRCLKNSKLEKTDIDDIILAGGSTRIPKIQEMLSAYFDGKVLNKTGNLDECVAAGAALQAAMLSKDKKQEINLFIMTEVASSSLGVADVTDKMDFVIRRNTPLPTSKCLTYSTFHDQQKTLTVEVYEGERMDAKKNLCLGDFQIMDLTPAPPGKCKIMITMNIDSNGILTATGEEMLQNNTKKLEITYTRAKRNKANLMKYDVENAEEDARFLKFVKIKRYVLEYCIKVRYNLKKKNLINSELQDVYKRCEEIETLVKNMDLGDKGKVKKYKNKIRKKCDPLVKIYNFEDMPSPIDEE